MRRALQGAFAVAGVALVVWAAWPYLAPHGRARTALSSAVPSTAVPSTAVPSTAAPTAAKDPPIDAVALASPQLAACPLATAPPQVPDGSTASREQMSAARTAFQNYDSATNAYAKCVDSAVQRLAGELKGKASPEELQRLEQFGRSARNTAIDQEQAVADRLNGQIRAFKARQP